MNNKEEATERERRRAMLISMSLSTMFTKLLFLVVFIIIILITIITEHTVIAVVTKELTTTTKKTAFLHGMPSRAKDEYNNMGIINGIGAGVGDGLGFIGGGDSESDDPYYNTIIKFKRRSSTIMSPCFRQIYSPLLLLHMVPAKWVTDDYDYDDSFFSNSKNHDRHTHRNNHINNNKNNDNKDDNNSDIDTTTDPYAILGVPFGTTDKTLIKTAYRQLAMKYHPDVVLISDDDNVPDEDKTNILPAKNKEKTKVVDANERFVKINTAYELLNMKKEPSSSPPLETITHHKKNNGYYSSSTATSWSSPSSYENMSNTKWWDIPPQSQPDIMGGGVVGMVVGNEKRSNIQHLGDDGGSISSTDSAITLRDCLKTDHDECDWVVF